MRLLLLLLLRWWWWRLYCAVWCVVYTCGVALRCSCQALFVSAEWGVGD